MFARILIAAVFAGAASGVVAALLQFMFVHPVLMAAEAFELGAVDDQNGPVVLTVQLLGDLAGFDMMRTALNVLFQMLTYTGFAMILVAGMAQAERVGHVTTPLTGLLWGLAGFITVQLAPGLGLPPDVPGVSTADIGARQLWWGITVGCTGLALWLIAFARAHMVWVLAIALLLAPHFVGAPPPPRYSDLVPPELAALFVARSLGVGLAGWAILGGLAAYFWRREDKCATIGNNRT